MISVWLAAASALFFSVMLVVFELKLFLVVIIILIAGYSNSLTEAVLTTDILINLLGAVTFPT